MKKSHLYIYAAYTSTCLEDRAWSFAVSLCMTTLGGMRMVSIEQLMEGFAQMIFSGHLGKAFDKASRKTAIMSVVPLNNLSIVIASGLMYACLAISDINNVIFPILLVLGMIMCSVNRLFLNAEKFLVGRDWVVVLDKQNLAELNATLTALDQLANVVSPLITGVLAAYAGLDVTCLIYGAASLVSMASKAFFLTNLWKDQPQLHIKEVPKKTEDEKEEKDVQRSCGQKFCNALSSIPSVIVTYYRQTIFLAALGMALLFMTVLGFDGLAVGYGQSIGLPESLIGAFRSLGSAMGIAGALSYAFFERRYGIRTTGLLGLSCQQLCLIMAVVSIWLPGSPMNLSGYFSGLTLDSWWNQLKNSFEGNTTNVVNSHIDWKHFTADGNSMVSIFVFLIGIATARFGLWMADLSITHIMQVGVGEHERNTVFGVHNALCQTFSVLKDLMVIALPDPSTFAICILISYGFVCSGDISYIAYLLRHPPIVDDVGKAESRSDSRSTPALIDTENRSAILADSDERTENCIYDERL